MTGRRVAAALLGAGLAATGLAAVPGASAQGPDPAQLGRFLAPFEVEWSVPLVRGTEQRTIEAETRWQPAPAPGDDASGGGMDWTWVVVLVAVGLGALIAGLVGIRRWFRATS